MMKMSQYLAQLLAAEEWAIQRHKELIAAGYIFVPPDEYIMPELLQEPE